MSQTGWKWFCSKCGRIVYGEEAPEECPKCFEWDSYGKIGEDSLEIDKFER